VHAPHALADVAQVVREIHHAALRELQLGVELGRSPSQSFSECS
jgi:hypothetical protein